MLSLASQLSCPCSNGVVENAASLSSSAGRIWVMSPRTRDARDPGGGVYSARWRPVEVPDDLDEVAPIKGRVRLPAEIAWSGQPEYDLGDRQQLRRVYEQVLRDGTADEIRHYLRASVLLELWDELFLPTYVRHAWGPWVSARRGTA
jgi:hypothetical protein